jgi:hypothetical protein
VNAQGNGRDGGRRRKQGDRDAGGALVEDENERNRKQADAQAEEEWLPVLFDGVEHEMNYRAVAVFQKDRDNGERSTV